MDMNQKCLNLVFLFMGLFVIGCQSTAIVVTESLRSDTGITEKWKIYKGAIAEVDGAEYRVYETGFKPRATIVFNHGFLDDVRFFEESIHDESGLRSLVNGLGSVRIVVVSFGLKWMFTPGEQRGIYPKEATISVFTKKVLPVLEAKYEFSGPYILIGRSMGASNSATLCASNPELWSKCILLNPMLVSDEIDPFKVFGNDQWKASYIIKSQYKDYDHWHESRPSSLLKSAKSLPKTYVTACKQDGFNLFDGAKQWVEQARTKGFEVIWDPVAEDCDHQTWPVENVVNFIINKPERLPSSTR